MPEITISSVVITPPSPRRIQRSRKAGWRMPSGAVYVGRPSKWGNNYRVIPVRPSGPFDILRGDGLFVAQSTGRADAQRIAVEKFRHAVENGWDGFPTIADIRAELAGRDLVCWCADGTPCHASDVLLPIANPEVFHA